jgi:hypothetical protein
MFAAMAAVAVALAACSPGGGGSTATEPRSAASDNTAVTAPAAGSSPLDTAASPSAAPGVQQVAESPVEDVPSGLSAARGGDPAGLPSAAVPLDELRSGGPPPDGIPPIDDPKFVAAGDVDFLAENEPVMAVDIDGDARAYPVQILIWHEIVNDTVGGVPVAVTYCPLCNSAVAYDRRVAGRVLRFGTSGLLWNSALVMWDRQTETLWSHFTGEAIVGVLTGTELETFPVATVPWGVWRDAHPGGLVLSRDTGFDRSYGSNPYPGYDDVNSLPFLFEGDVDGRFTAMTRVIGIQQGEAAIAVPLVDLRRERIVKVTVGGSEITVWWAPGTTSALDENQISDGEDVGASGAFIALVDGKPLTFTSVEAGFVDDQTGSTWNLLGQATAGPLAGSQLEPVEHVDTFWFAWSTFRPGTEVFLAG